MHNPQTFACPDLVPIQSGVRAQGDRGLEDVLKTESSDSVPRASAISLHPPLASAISLHPPRQSAAAQNREDSVDHPDLVTLPSG